jgi:hypothetical protein
MNNWWCKKTNSVSLHHFWQTLTDLSTLSLPCTYITDVLYCLKETKKMWYTMQRSGIITHGKKICLCAFNYVSQIFLEIQCCESEN